MLFGLLWILIKVIGIFKVVKCFFNVLIICFVVLFLLLIINFKGLNKDGFIYFIKWLI